jgi:hypothetical protein
MDLGNESRWRLGAALALGCLTGIMLATFLDYGLIWDEEFQRIYGDHVINWYTSGFQDKRALSYRNLFLYGGFFDVTAQLWARLSPLPLYEDRHLVNVLFAILALAGTYRLGTMLAGPRAGCLALIALALTPMFYGHAFNNPKDIPFATLFVWALVALIRCARSLPEIAWWQTAKLAILVGFMLGIRVGGIFFFGYLGLLWAATLWARSSDGFARDWPSLMRNALRSGAALAAVIAIAWVVMLIWWPWAQVHPIDHPRAAIRHTVEFDWDHDVLFMGARFNARAVPRTYLPVWFAMTLPELHCIAWLAGLAAIAIRIKNRDTLMFSMLELGFVAFAVLFPILTAIALRSTHYDAVRHFLFVVPPLAVLTGISLDAVWRLQQVRWFRMGALAACAFAALVTASDMIQLHPYESVYFNRLIAGGLPGAAGRYETDYWGNSYRAATEWVLANVQSSEPLRVANCSYPLLSSYFMQQQAKGARFISVGPDERPDILLATTRWNCNRQAGARVLHTIERQGVPLAYVMDLRTPDRVHRSSQPKQNRDFH